jgi:protein phosphatase
LDLGQNRVSGASVSLYAVADGLGGYEGGEIASKMALKVMAENISKFILSASWENDLNNKAAISKALTVGIRAANNEVLSQSHTYANNMATTLVTALVINDSAYIANVGDSRAYCLDGGQIRQITVDHSLVAGLVSAGEIGPEELYTHPQRNIVTRWLGSDMNMEVDLFNEILKPNKSLILCSDGLWEMVKDIHIEKIVLEQSTAQEACEQLVDMAKQNGGIDNISVIIVKVTG